MSKVTILRGISGSGKTTYASKHYPNTLVVSADHFFGTPPRYKFDPEKLPEAHNTCLRLFIEAVRNGRAVVVDNTNTTVEEIAPYYALAEAYGHEVEIVTIEFDPLVAAQRNVHNVPLEAIERQHYRICSTVLPRRWKHRTVPREMAR